MFAARHFASKFAKQLDVVVWIQKVLANCTTDVAFLLFAATDGINCGVIMTA